MLALLVAGITLVGAGLRVALVGQDLFADEFSTRWMIAGHGLGEVISRVYTDAEITPPLFFAASWVTTRAGLDPELVPLPSLIAGIALIPLVYLIGERTVGRRAAVVGAALVALSPFLAYYSAEARGYQLMVTLVAL